MFHLRKETRLLMRLEPIRQRRSVHGRDEAGQEEEELHRVVSCGICWVYGMSV